MRLFMNAPSTVQSHSPFGKSIALPAPKKTKEAAEFVARITVLGDRRATLKAIVAEIKEAVGCDAVVLFEYDQSAKRLLPPKVIGVRDKAKLFSPEEERDYPLIYRLLEE